MSVIRKVVAILVAAVAVTLIGCTSAMAQLTTPCPAGTTSATVKSNAPFTLSWCQKPTPGLTGVTDVTAARVTGIGPTPQTLSGLTVLSGPYTDGMYQMRGTISATPKGSYTFTLAVTSTQTVAGTTTSLESGESAPFVLSVVDPAAIPATPINMRIP